MRMLFVVDPIGGLDPCHDSSVAIMEAAQERGHDVLVTTAARLAASAGRPVASAARIELRPVRLESGRWVADSPWFRLADTERVALDDVDVVWMRTDPPVDDDYLSATFLLDLADPSRTLVVNRPSGLREANEKFFGLRFPDLMPATDVSADVDDLTSVVASRGVAVLKPVQGMAGRGILLLRREDPNLRSILESATLRGRRHVVVQEFLPSSADGDRRLIVVGGEPVGVVRRVAGGGDFRCNMAAGASVHGDAIDARDREICTRLADSLMAHGLFFVGLDVIGGMLTEVNVTSPTGIREIDRLNGQRVGHDLVAWVEGAAPSAGGPRQPTRVVATPRARQPVGSRT